MNDPARTTGLTMTQQSSAAMIKREVRAQVNAALATNDCGFDSIASLAAVRQITSLSEAQIWRKVAAGSFPQPVMISIGRRGWLMSEIQAWISDRRAERDSGALVRRSPQLYRIKNDSSGDSFD
jgi:prophage regulatory protein